MNDVGHYQRTEVYRTGGGVTTHRGVDPVTGLAVLIYDFLGRPLAGPGDIDSDAVPAILAASFDGERGSLVAAIPTGASLVAPGESVVDDRFVLQTLQALRDGARAGVIHGDLGAERLLFAGGRVLVEGYGVPWAASAGGTDRTPGRSAALQRDMQAAVNALIDLAGDNLSSEVLVALRGAMATGTNPPPDAERLYGVVRRLSGGAVTVPSAGFSELTLPVSAASGGASTAPGKASEAGLDDALDLPDAADADHEIGAAPGVAPSLTATRTDVRVDPAVHHRSSDDGAHHATDPDPITLASDPGLVARATRSPKDSDPGFVKDLPPGATYRPGNLDGAMRPAPIRLDRLDDGGARRRSWRGPALLLLLVIVAGGAAYMAVLAQRANRQAIGGSGIVRHVVDVRIDPANLPPVSLVVDQSPSGSSFRSGTVIGSVPRRVVFDATGTWVVHAAFQGRTSDRVTLRVPEDRTLTLTFPPAADEQP
ncbi:MAG: hypothetical protein R6W77_05665 [Trueperaceae bacterium]